MKVVVTGSGGFLGSHVCARLRALRAHDVVPIDRTTFDDAADLDSAVAGADAIIHLAGINRGDDVSLEYGNRMLAEQLAAALNRAGTQARVVFANSVQGGNGTCYGTGKAAAASVLTDWAGRTGGELVDVRLPNLFGEGGRPYYNSFVATFCHRLANGEQPVIDVDRPVPLMHAQDAASVLIDLADSPLVAASIEPEVTVITVSEVGRRLVSIASIYAAGEIPDLSDPLQLRLFNTYRSYLYPEQFPRRLNPMTDSRGSFVEVVRSGGGQGQTSFSTTEPGITRGNHFHLRKVERFAVIEGQAVISIRPIGRTAVWTFSLDGDEPAYVDIPTLCTHNITNIGDSTLLTLFWISETYDPADPDTFAEVV